MVTGLRRCLILTSLVVAVLAVTTAPALAQRKAAPEPPANDLCLACHGDPGATRSNGTPMAVDEKKFGASIHGTLGLACVTCHTDLAKATDFPHAEKLARVNCGTCHDSAAAAYDKSIHASARRESAGSVAATCVDCHTKHDIRSAKDPESRTYPLNLPATCGHCHGDANIIKKGNIRIGNVVTLYEDSIHGKAISRSGLLVAANCTSCHGNHDIRKRTDAGSRVFRANIPSVCGSCHEGIKTLYDQGAHGAALARGQKNAPVCIDCHTAHNIQRIDVTSWRLDVIRECGTCHADQIRTYRDTFHGQVTSLGFVRVATCSDCHGAHDVHPQSDARSTVSDAHRLATCQKCHPTATASFARYDPHANKKDAARDPILYYAAFFMKWLLIGTFGFFGLHALAWLPRGLVARRQQAQRAKPAEPASAKGSSEASAVEPVEPAEPRDL